MSSAGSLVPPAIRGHAHNFKRLPVAFGDRFLVLLLMGIAWLGPAFVQWRFVYAMVAWDMLILAGWAIDLAWLPRPELLSVERIWETPPALSVPASVDLKLLNSSAVALHAKLVDYVPVELRIEPSQMEIHAGPRSEAAGTYQIQPSKRGKAVLGDVYLRYQSPFRLAERWAMVTLDQTVCVYPNLEEARKHSMYLMRSRQIEMQRRYVQTRGMGREFESLRDYRVGDDLRDVCWTASARRAKLVTRMFQVERSQTIWIVIDSGRLMRARVNNLSKLDYAVNAALSLAQVGLYSGDRVGLLAYGRKIRQRAPASHGSLHLRQLILQLASVHEETAEANHLQAASYLLQSQKRRSLVVWLTDLAETAITPEVIEAASQMTPRHLVLLVVMGQPDLKKLAQKEPQDVTEMFQAAAAQEVVHRRDLLLARLRERGVLALEVDSAALAPALINSYLEIKQRGQL